MGLILIIIGLVLTSQDVQAVEWKVDVLIKEWLITPEDLAITGDEIYISGNFDNRIIVLNLRGQIQRYYTIEKNRAFDNVCVDVTSEGRVYALSSQGLWELKPDGETEKVAIVPFDYIEHMMIGPNDVIYFSYNFRGGSAIATLDLDGTISNVLYPGSNRISDFDFDSHGNLIMFDAQVGQILKYTPDSGIEILASGLSQFGGGPGYLSIKDDEIYFTYQSPYHLSLRNGEVSITPLEFEGGSDFVFYNGSLYIMDVYASILYCVELDYVTVVSNRVLLDGLVPWAIDNQGDIIVGQRSDGGTSYFYNYFLDDTFSVMPNTVLTSWEFDYFTFDDFGNAYLLNHDSLVKITASGDVEYQVDFWDQDDFSDDYSWGPGIRYNPVDGKIYAYDEESNSVFMIGENGVDLFHNFSVWTKRAFLAITPKGRIYAAAIVPGFGSKVVDITNPEEEIHIWSPGEDYFWFHLDSDVEGNLYAAMGPGDQQVYFINVSEGKAVSMVTSENSSYDYGFVDPQGLAVTMSGDVVLSVPGFLLKFTRVGMMNSSLSISVSEKIVGLNRQVTVSGVISPTISSQQPVEVTLNYSDPDGVMHERTVRSISGNRYSDTFLVPSRSGRWSFQASWEGNSTISGSTSHTISLFIAEPEKTPQGIPGFPVIWVMMGILVGIIILGLQRSMIMSKFTTNDA